jgi:hypothetical protein
MHVCVQSNYLLPGLFGICFCENSPLFVVYTESTYSHLLNVYVGGSFQNVAHDYVILPIFTHMYTWAGTSLDALVPGVNSFRAHTISHERVCETKSKLVAVM